MKMLHIPGLVRSGLFVGMYFAVLTPRFASAQIRPPYPTNFAPAVRITSPPNRAVFYAPANIPIYAYARDLWYGITSPGTNGAITNVQFFADTNDLGSGHRVQFHSPPYAPYVLALNEWELTWSNAQVGAYALTAVAYNGNGRAITSAAVNITVVTPPPPPTNVPPFVSIIASDPIAIEGTNCWIWRGLTNVTPVWSNWPPVVGWAWFTNCGPKNGAFSVRRLGATNDALNVSYTIGGTATNGVDYMTLSNSVTIPAGEVSAQISVVPLDDGKPDIDSTVVLALNPDNNSPPNYLQGFPRKAAVFIIDSAKPRPATALLRDECFHLNAAGPDGAWFCVQYSTDLLNWSLVCTNQVVEGSIDFIDPDSAGDSGRFYRAVPQPGGP